MRTVNSILILVLDSQGINYLPLIFLPTFRKYLLLSLRLHTEKTLRVAKQIKYNLLY